VDGAATMWQGRWNDYSIDEPAWTEIIVEYSSVPDPATLIIWSLLGSLGIGFGWWWRRKAA
jgi:hypothetical protein